MTPSGSAMSCPRCAATLEPKERVHRCPQCHGGWIRETILTAMVAERTSAPLLFAARGGEALACPGCGQPSTPQMIEGVAIDRCAGHGVWFDTDELESALQRVGRSRGPVVVAAVATSSNGGVDGVDVGIGILDVLFDLFDVFTN